MTTLTWIVIIAGAIVFGLYLLGRLTPESRISRPIIDTSVVPQPIKVLAFIAVTCVVIIWLAGGR